ncbi:MAG: hypothetical protein EOP04_13430 [Proteobacteria bacterium]|nr:MAG: hypothetical protein EOP04_13430 [Pseudomonadota bacterium]
MISRQKFINVSLIIIFMRFAWLYYRINQYEYDRNLVTYQILSVKDGIAMFKKENGRFPESISELTLPESRPFIRRGEELDQYLNQFRYRLVDNDRYSIASAGEDGKFDTWDDYILDTTGRWNHFALSDAIFSNPFSY